MKTLILFRHGKSDWGARYQGDHNRPVAKRGRKAAALMGRFLRKTGQTPDSVVTSSALRARTTVELAHESGGWGCPVRVTDQLYDAQCQDLLREIHAEPDATERLLLAGHEPTFSEMIGRLTGQVVNFPTASMGRIDFDGTSWSQVEFGAGRLVWLVHPKLLKKSGF